MLFLNTAPLGEVCDFVEYILQNYLLLAICILKQTQMPFLNTAVESFAWFFYSISYWL
jgi:hypothetical protein